MLEHSFLINLLLAMSAALGGAVVARLLRLPAILGYLIAGIAVGPHTPGPIAESRSVQPVANLGVILLMFAIGAQLSVRKLRSVGLIALGVGSIQIMGTAAVGFLIGRCLGWTTVECLFLGCAIALSSTAVAMRLLEDREELDTQHGNLMIGVLVIQDLSMILMAAVLPALGSSTDASWANIGFAIGKAIAFLVATVLLALSGVPIILGLVARLASRELFTIAVLVICLGAAVVAEIGGLGFALGAFLAGIIVSESDHAHDVMTHLRPIRDVFSALFFVSIGMLLNPRFLLNHWGEVAIVVAAIVIVKPVLTAIPARLLGADSATAVTAGVGISQIGEFSFVLASLLGAKGVISSDLTGIVLAGAIVTIVAAPFLFSAARLAGARRPVSTRPVPS